MDTTELCFVSQGLVFFPAGKIDPSNCTLADFRPIVGHVPGAYGIEGLNQLVFPHQLGSLNIFFHPEEDVTDQSKVLMFQIKLNRLILLEQLILFYRTDPKKMVEVVIEEEAEETIHTAMFSPNFGVEFDPMTKRVSTFVFTALSHILNCPCDSCSYVRQQFNLRGK